MAPGAHGGEAGGCERVIDGLWLERWVGHAVNLRQAITCVQLRVHALKFPSWSVTTARIDLEQRHPVPIDYTTQYCVGDTPMDGWPKFVS